MAYRQPGVKVTQIFLEAQPSLAAEALPNVSVGAAYQLEFDKLAGTYNGSLTAYAYPNLLAGALVDLTTLSDTSELAETSELPVDARIKNAVLEIVAEVSSGFTEAADLTLLNDLTASLYDKVVIGDKVVFVVNSGVTILAAQTDGVTAASPANVLNAGTAGQFANVKVGDTIHIKGHTTDMELTVESMQIDNVGVKEAKAGDAVGIKVSERVRRGDIVYKVTD